MNEKEIDKDFWFSWVIINIVFATPLSCVILYLFIEQPINIGILAVILGGLVLIVIVTLWQTLAFRKLVANSKVVAFATGAGWLVSFVITLLISNNAASFSHASSQGGNAVSLIALPVGDNFERKMIFFESKRPCAFNLVGVTEPSKFE